MRELFVSTNTSIDYVRHFILIDICTTTPDRIIFPRCYPIRGLLLISISMKCLGVSSNQWIIRN